MWKFDSAASPFILNLKSGDSGHLLVDFMMCSMVSIIFLGRILDGALMTIATDWNTLLDELGSLDGKEFSFPGGNEFSFPGGVDALSHFGVLQDGVPSQA
jgi:hypothetical protein